MDQKVTREEREKRGAVSPLPVVPNDSEDGVQSQEHQQANLNEHRENTDA